ncbi:hypothetical protein CSHISOI_04754 [Colletotrichum shisoi]|uniref:C2H2-type domain-containing protein n=1 Tax=Colletotrichum shisoi TaxID=2078593 RepID=A0A5Q4BW59_9PEZI|nr:hypothetical protein CSHISOI_04754 [Colletotrichum shisoi]
MPFPRHALYIPVPVTSESSVSTSSQVKAEEIQVAHKVVKKVPKPVHKAATRVAPMATNEQSSKSVSGSYTRLSNRPARKAAKNTASMASSKATIGAANRAAAKVAVRASKSTINVRQDDREEDTESEDDEMEPEREDRPGLVRIRALNKAPGMCYTDEKGKKRWPCNLCSRHWSRKDETRAHLRRVHYAEKYPEGFDKARGLKQAQLDCP